MANITAKEIAKTLGLSQAAVSLALRDKPGVSEETRKLVRETAVRMGKPFSTAMQQALTSRRISFVIFMDHLVSIAENTTFSSFLLKGAADRASSLGHSISVCYINAGEAALRDQLEKVLPDTDGILFLGTDITEKSRTEINAVFAEHPEIPLIVLDSVEPIAGADYVCNDNFGGARMATEHLIQRGCRRIGYFRSSFRNQNYIDRQEGVACALQDAGLDLFCMMNTDVSFDGAYKSTVDFLNNTSELPDGVFAENDVVAAAAIRACNSFGIKVPEQLSVIGFDDTPICELCSPALSTVTSHKEQLGKIAVDILLRRMDDPASEERASMKIYLSTSLHIRDSVK